MEGVAAPPVREVLLAERRTAWEPRARCQWCACTCISWNRMSSTPASAAETSGGWPRRGPRPDEDLRDPHLASERLRHAPEVPARERRVRAPLGLGEQVLREPSRQDELAPERLAQALAEQRAREGIDDPGDEHAV